MFFWNSLAFSMGSLAFLWDQSPPNLVRIQFNKSVWGRKWEEGSKGMGHIDIWQKPSQFCNYPPIKNKFKKTFDLHSVDVGYKSCNPCLQEESK